MFSAPYGPVSLSTSVYAFGVRYLEPVILSLKHLNIERHFRVSRRRPTKLMGNDEDIVSFFTPKGKISVASRSCTKM